MVNEIEPRRQIVFPKHKTKSTEEKPMKQSELIKYLKSLKNESKPQEKIFEICVVQELDEEAKFLIKTQHLSRITFGAIIGMTSFIVISVCCIFNTIPAMFYVSLVATILMGV